MYRCFNKCPCLEKKVEQQIKDLLDRKIEHYIHSKIHEYHHLSPLLQLRCHHCLSQEPDFVVYHIYSIHFEFQIQKEPVLFCLKHVIYPTGVKGRTSHFPCHTLKLSLLYSKLFILIMSFNFWLTGGFLQGTAVSRTRGIFNMLLFCTASINYWAVRTLFPSRTYFRMAKLMCAALLSHIDFPL